VHFNCGPSAQARAAARPTHSGQSFAKSSPHLLGQAAAAAAAPVAPTAAAAAAAAAATAPTAQTKPVKSTVCPIATSEQPVTSTHAVLPASERLQLESEQLAASRRRRQAAQRRPTVSLAPTEASRSSDLLSPTSHVSARLHNHCSTSSSSSSNRDKLSAKCL